MVMRAVKVAMVLVLLIRITVKDNVWLVSGKIALIVQVPVLPDVAKEPAVATVAGLAANARVGGSTSWYCT